MKDNDEEEVRRRLRQYNFLQPLTAQEKTEQEEEEEEEEGVVVVAVVVVPLA